MELKEQLASVPLLAGVPDKVRRRLAEIGKRRRYAPGEVIVREGESGIAFYIVLTGSARVEQGGQAIGQLAAGDFFGELALIEEHERTATVVADEETECLGWTRWEFTALLNEHPEVAVPIMHVLIKRLHRREHHGA
ncbi:MAG TPA: cyclic nucleotide-binding domain-containing protein [Candidatus Limnocylindrales bacterium]|nr:cyclic nucleotide-binding domain-containing protein [Candidatus Limnocylindrales bacterium]